MKVCVFGLGYVGFTAMCCMASEGHVVVGVDTQEGKIQAIRRGVAPIIEPNVDEMLKTGLADGFISVSTEIGQHLEEAELAIVCVGTPSAVDGSHNMEHIAEVTRQIASNVQRDRPSFLTVVYRSTVRPGTMETLIAPIFRSHLGDDFDRTVELIYNPEFLRESSAVADYFAPPKIVVGTSDGAPSERINELYRNIAAPTFNRPFREAEFTKFVDNSWHALKVAYANEIGGICLQLGISAARVHEIFVSDTKLNISPYYTRPGGAFGGSCLPKDVRALQYIASETGASVPVVDALIRSNEAHKYRIFQMAVGGLQPGAAILLAGVAFKAGTDDLRESPNVDLARALLREGYRLSIFDPAIDAGKLVGANLGYAYTQLPELSSLLISKGDAEGQNFDRVLVANATIDLLDLRANQDVLNIGAIA